MERDESIAMMEPPAGMEPTAAGLTANYLTRQPILDSHRRLYGYQIVGRPTVGLPREPFKAANYPMDNYLRLVPETQGGTVFVRPAREVLMGGVMTVLPPQTTVFELDPGLESDADVVEYCRGLRGRGFRFALTDLRPSETRPAFLQVADFVTIDLRRTDAAERKLIYAMVKGHRAKLVAKNVATPAEMEMLREEGCHYFQGFFFAYPTVATHKPIPANQMVYVRVLAALSSLPQKTSEIERIILSDSTLCYRLLRLVNSALYTLSSHVTSIRTALVLIGYDGIRKLVTIALAGMYADKQPKALSLLALERAYFCEALAPLLDRPAPELYLLGMLSLIDVMMQAPIEGILDALPLPPEMCDALAGKSNPLGELLAFIRAYEAGDWERCDTFRQTIGLRQEQAATMYADSLRWAATALVV